jgi:hypothetical protein
LPTGSRFLFEDDWIPNHAGVANAFEQIFVESASKVRFPMKPPTHPKRKPATDSDLKPAGVPI